jgi:hypothetical protein
MEDKEITTIEAIESLASGKYQWCDANGGVAWKDDAVDVPTEAEIQAEVIRLQAVYDSQEYARNRKAEYDQLNQFEMQFDDLETGATVWQDTINEIKGRYPK